MNTNNITPEQYFRWLSLTTGEVRVPIATAPRKAIYQRDRMTVYRYERETPAEHKVPILLVYSLINRPSILDLLPRRSVVRHLLKRGFDVYLIDWGEPDGLDRFAGLDTYLNLHLRSAVREVCKHAGQPKLTLFGYCMGGSMAAMFTALHPQRVQNLILLGAPFDFRSDELLYRWGCDATRFNPEKLVDVLGNIPTWAFEGFTTLKIDTKLPRLRELYEKQNDQDYLESYLAMEQWVGDNIPMAGAVWAEFVKQCFQENALIEGRAQVGGVTVDLSKIQCPTLILAGDKDHLVPAETATALTRVVPHADTIVTSTGHIGLSVSGASHRVLWPQACDWMAARSATVATPPEIGMQRGCNTAAVKSA